MAEQSAPGIALLVDCRDRRRRLSEAVQHFGYRVVFEGAPVLLRPEQLAEVETDLWLVDLDNESPLADWLLDHCEVPVLLGNDDIPACSDEEFPRWQRRLFGKLSRLLGVVGAMPQWTPPVPAPRQYCVWLLGASLGGPAAVKRFLDALSPLLPIAFIYAQHIDAGFEQQLPRILSRENDWQVRNCEDGMLPQPGEVLVAPISQMLSFGARGQVCLQQDSWPGAYQPAIETLLDTMAASFSPHCGAIIFSGMGEDGVQACGRMRDQGMQVWTQSAASAACAVMPQAVQQAGYSCLEGSPEELAQALRRWLEQERPASA